MNVSPMGLFVNIVRSGWRKMISLRLMESLGDLLCQSRKKIQKHGRIMSWIKQLQELGVHISNSIRLAQDETEVGESRLVHEFSTVKDGNELAKELQLEDNPDQRIVVPIGGDSDHVNWLQVEGVSGLFDAKSETATVSINGLISPSPSLVLFQN
ncbi:hypothetical protein VNO78_07954 [Psophocarpus tetragonolobus]|uniref:Uncharacterized protein n=1 Tax=Psophocarpus tetragonolobus TaxID=3891 RepID=A0AAN9SUA5_PSOTE